MAVHCEEKGERDDDEGYGDCLRSVMGFEEGGNGDALMQARTSFIETLVAVPLHSAMFMPKTEVKKERGSCNGQ